MADQNADTPDRTTLKFLCSYDGRILPRQSDGKLRYYGGHTRVLSVDRSVSFSELLVKLGEMCGTSVNLRCQLPDEDLDALVSIKSDEDLSNLIEEYDRSSLKIRAFLSTRRSIKQISPPRSFISPLSSPPVVIEKCYRPIITTSPPVRNIARGFNKSGLIWKTIHQEYPYYAHGHPNNNYIFHNGNYCQ